jgi:hypothetical protein
VNNVLQKTKSITLEDTAVERHHNSTCNRLVAISRIEHHIEILQVFFSSGFELQGKVARLSTLMVDT